MKRTAKPAKAKVKAKPPLARRSPKNEGSKGRSLQKRLAEALEQQAATSEILRVISRSLTDVQPVFESIAANALRLCDASFSTIFRFDGEFIHIAAHHNLNPAGTAAFRSAYPSRPSRGGATHRAILTGSIANIADVLADPEYTYHDAAKSADYRSALSVPMLRDGRPIGTITVYRDVPKPFPDAQIELLKTFADQAVIAIENVRLFNETKEALDQQTATAQILQAISSAPGDLQPVLDTLVRAAAQFCGATDVLIMRLEDGMLRGAAAVGPFADVLARGAGSVEAIEIPVTKGTVAGRSVLECRTIHIHDLAAEREDEYPEGRELQRRFGHHTMVATPLLREGVPLGLIALFRLEVKPFSDKQISLLQIFADQAVIAIENVRLFTELEARNRDLTEALEQQTATSDILRV
ncbi:MAG: GAF domain-containing protein, partial [Pseudomonadota bacterium]|nr:GAF domain-containing protein [Pseudomonadota bacterium]